jgi:hypothetical protein
MKQFFILPERIDEGRTWNNRIMREIKTQKAVSFLITWVIILVSATITKLYQTNIGFITSASKFFRQLYSTARWLA